jgi:hypothetical protein
VPPRTPTQKAVKTTARGNREKKIRGFFDFNLLPQACVPLKITLLFV